MSLRDMALLLPHLFPGKGDSGRFPANPAPHPKPSSNGPLPARQTIPFPDFRAINDKKEVRAGLVQMSLESHRSLVYESGFLGGEV